MACEQPTLSCIPMMLPNLQGPKTLRTSSPKPLASALDKACGIRTAALCFRRIRSRRGAIFLVRSLTILSTPCSRTGRDSVITSALGETSARTEPLNSTLKPPSSCLSRCTASATAGADGAGVTLELIHSKDLTEGFRAWAFIGTPSSDRLEGEYSGASGRLLGRLSGKMGLVRGEGLR